MFNVISHRMTDAAAQSIKLTQLGFSQESFASEQRLGKKIEVMKFEIRHDDYIIYQLTLFWSTGTNI
jgi:hypothetical protein